MSEILEIKGIKLQRYKGDLARLFLTNFRDVAEQCPVIREKFNAQYSAFVRAHDEVIRVYSAAIKSPESDKLVRLDSRRDILVTVVRTATRSALKALDYATRSLAQEIWQAMISFKVDTKDHYLSETAELDTLIDVLLTKHHDAVQAIGILPIVEQMRDLEEEYHSLIEQRDKRLAQNPVGQRPRAMHAALGAYRLLAKYINSYRLISDLNGIPTPDLDNLILQINVFSQDLRATKRHRKHKTEGEEEETVIVDEAITEEDSAE